MTDTSERRYPAAQEPSIGAGAQLASWFFETADELFAVVCAEGAFVLVNAAWEKVTGWSASELVGRQVMDFVHPASHNAVVATVEDLRRDGHVRTQMQVKTKAGGWVWLEGHSRLGPNNEMFGTLRDTTSERARAEELERSRMVGVLLSETAGVGLWSFDPRLNELEWSPEWRSMLADAGAEMRTPEDFMELCHPDDLPNVMEVFDRAIAEGKPGFFDHRIRTRTGRWMCLRAHVRAEFVEDGMHIVHGISQNITELAEARDAALMSEQQSRAAEKAAQEAAEAKSSFLANMSHEIRTPMNGVLGVLHLLSNQDLPADSHALLEEALDCGRMLQALLDDVIDFSKIEAGKLELAEEPVDPTALLQGVAKLLRPQAEDKGLTLRVETEALPAWVLTDPLRLRQSLFNLMGNAVKFTPEGGVTVRAMRAKVGGKAGLRFEVEDTGIGVSRAAQAKLFSRFQQADASTTRRFGGSGLGLAISRRLAQMMGGEIGLTSKVGKGSTFWMEIAAPETGAPARSVADTSDLLDGLRVLVVEDNATNRMIATRMLEGLGAVIETAEDGERGVAAARRSAFDLILMDIQMPGIDGLEATRRIRRIPAMRGVPIVALTANALVHQRDTYLAAGMSGVVSKPISPAALLAEITRLASGETAERAVSAA